MNRFTSTHRPVLVDPALFARGNQAQRERTLQHLPWADEHGRAWTALRILIDLAVCAAVLATPFILWSVA